MPGFFRCTRALLPECTVWAVTFILFPLLLSIPVTPLQALQASTDTAAVDTLNAVRGEPGKESAPEEENPRIIITLKKGGEIVIELLPDEAPVAVQRILELVGEGFYDGVKFHRVVSYLVQTGKKKSDLPPVEGEMFAQSLKHTEGMVGMARLPDDYDSATTQFYIMKEYRSKLNSEYTLFGRVVRGMNLVHRIKKGDRIVSIRVHDRD